MKPVMRCLLFLGVLVAFACEERECCALKNTELSSLEGKWRLFEEGYSPGIGYVVNLVPPTPEQYIFLKSQSRFESNIEGLTDIESYWIFYDTVHRANVLGLFRDQLATDDPDLADAILTYNMTLSNDTLTLGFRYCYEGCHLRLKRVD